MSDDKKENWPKFMKEMNELGPLLNENIEQRESGVIGANGKLNPINNKFQLVDKSGALIQTKDELAQQEGSRIKRRKERAAQKRYEKRLKKAADDKEYLNRMLQMDRSRTWLKDAKRVTEWKQEKINTWFDEELMMMLGSEKVIKIKECVEKKGRFPLRYFYIKLKVQHEVEPYPWGTDHLAVYVFGQLHSSVTYVWEG